jgi:hypothetical protein
MAKLAQSVEQRSILFEMAQTWQELAERTARLEKIEANRKRDSAA